MWLSFGKFLSICLCFDFMFIEWFVNCCYYLLQFLFPYFIGKSLILFRFITFCLQEVCIKGWLQLTSKCTWFTTEFRIILMRTIFGFNDKFTIGKEYVVHTISWYISAWKKRKKNMTFYFKKKPNCIPMIYFRLTFNVDLLFVERWSESILCWTFISTRILCCDTVNCQRVCFCNIKEKTTENLINGCFRRMNLFAGEKK